jgi:hypothetical protein
MRDGPRTQPILAPESTPQWLVIAPHFPTLAFNSSKKFPTTITLPV